MVTVGGLEDEDDAFKGLEEAGGEVKGLEVDHNDLVALEEAGGKVEGLEVDHDDVVALVLEKDSWGAGVSGRLQLRTE